MILSCQNISKSFSEQQILQNVSFHIEDNEKAAIVGINGAGKTTLLRILIGEMEADSGIVALSKDKTFGYLAQNASSASGRTIYDELLSVKQELIDLEEKMRFCEQNMKHAEGEQLEELMKQYTFYTHQFETGNGYAYKSELTGVLKGLLGVAPIYWTAGGYPFRRSEDPCGTGTSPSVKTRSDHSG